MAPRLPMAVLCEDIRSLNNVGSIFRTCDGAGVERLYLCGHTGHPPRPEIDKTALGSVASVPWEYIPNQFEAVRGLRRRGYRIIALERTEGSVPYDRAEYAFPACLVLGNEVRGITQEMLALCDMAVEIPMRGAKGSLNVAVAFGIAAYHMAAACERTIGERQASREGAENAEVIVS